MTRVTATKEFSTGSWVPANDAPYIAEVGRGDGLAVASADTLPHVANVT